MKTILTALVTLTLLASCAAEENPNLVVGELASDRHELTAEVSEPILSIAISEGEVVIAGQILIEQDREYRDYYENSAVQMQSRCLSRVLSKDPRCERHRQQRQQEHDALARTGRQSRSAGPRCSTKNAAMHLCPS